MKLNQLQTTRKKSVRLGRGIAGKGGKTAGRGTKGQKSRSGYNIPKRFEGGQSSFIQRMPKKRGFKSNAIKSVIVKLSILDSYFADGEIITPNILLKKGLVDKNDRKIKILFDKKISKKFKVSGCLFSKSVQQYVENKAAKK